MPNIIKNSEPVRAYLESGEVIETKYGQLKNDFMSKKITARINKIQLVRNKQFYFAKYHRTKGYKLIKLKDKE